MKCYCNNVIIMTTKSFNTLESLGVLLGVLVGWQADIMVGDSTAFFIQDLCMLQRVLGGWQVGQYFGWLLHALL